MRIGIDLGGTKIEALALAPGGREAFRRRVPTPRGDYAGTVRAIAGLVAAADAAAGERGTVGVGIPGVISRRTGLVKNANSRCLIGHPLESDIAAAVGRPVRLANDANCFALSEASDGAAAGARVVFGVIVGTGTGGGVVVDGRVLDGANGIAGEWGHTPLPWSEPGEHPGPACWCGQRGCIETFLSGPGIARDHAERTGEALEAGEIGRRASAGDAGCAATLARHAGRMARALAGVINLLDPDVVVLGGGVSNLPHLYEDVPRLWGRWIFSDAVDTRLVPPAHGDASGVRGAAWLWAEGERPGG
ncbi:MAG: ROK family protein [Planctomycetes bacterium]|nr:ROK family protein [Planctomycetota bacterium]